jgi:hypothetical protein
MFRSRIRRTEAQQKMKTFLIAGLCVFAVALQGQKQAPVVTVPDGFYTGENFIGYSPAQNEDITKE